MNLFLKEIPTYMIIVMRFALMLRNIKIIPPDFFGKIFFSLILAVLTCLLKSDFLSAGGCGLCPVPVLLAGGCGLCSVELKIFFFWN